MCTTGSLCGKQSSDKRNLGKAKEVRERNHVREPKDRAWRELAQISCSDSP